MTETNKNQGAGGRNTYELEEWPSISKYTTKVIELVFRNHRFSNKFIVSRTTLALSREDFPTRNNKTLGKNSRNYPGHHQEKKNACQGS